MNEQKASEVLKQINELCVSHTISEVVELLSSEWERCYTKIFKHDNHFYLKSKCYANTRLCFHNYEGKVKVFIAIPPEVNTWHSSF